MAVASTDTTAPNKRKTMLVKPNVASACATKSTLKQQNKIDGHILFIRQLNGGPGKELNKDFGSYVTTTQWKPVFNKIRQGGGPESSLPL